MTALEFLIQFPPFSKTGRHELARLSATFRKQSFARGETIMHPKKRISHIGFIASGSADLVIREAEVLSTMGKGDFYGVTDFFVTGYGMSSLVSREETVCYTQTAGQFQKMTDQHPAVKNFFYQLALRSLWKAYQITAHDGRTAAGPPAPAAEDPGLPRNVKKALAYIDRKYTEPVTLGDVSRECNLSKYYFSRVFKTCVGMSFKAYLNQKRIEAAKRLMAFPDLNMTEICFSVGFNDLSYFSRVFQRSEGVTPTRYRTLPAGPGGPDPVKNPVSIQP